LLEHRTEGECADGWWKKSGYTDEEYRRVAPVAERLLAAPALRRFFDSAVFDRAWNEVDITAGDGTLRRIDRLVDTGGELWVLDYKSSGGDTDRLDDYRAQVRAYCQAVAGAFHGRSVRGALLFGDGTVVDVMS
jgi:ATP-dependent helicase/nuclease subunit A